MYVSIRIHKAQFEIVHGERQVGRHFIVEYPSTMIFVFPNGEVEIPGYNAPTLYMGDGNFKSLSIKTYFT